MTIEQALQLIAQVCTGASLPLNTHMQLQQALQLINSKCLPPPAGNEIAKAMKKVQEDAQKKSMEKAALSIADAKKKTDATK